MPAPLTCDQLLALIQKSSLVPAECLDAYSQQVQSGDIPAGAQELARRMVQDGVLTTFQAEQFLLGKWRGFSIGKYKVLERLGSGGMGSVYLCEHLLMRHKVAVKVLPTAKSHDPAALGRFYREARAAAQLDHPNLVRGHDVDVDGELHYLVMEYVDGVNLQHLVTRHGPLSILRACHYIYQSALGLQAAFESGLVHRDIKPANLLLDRSGTVRVLDMGLARFYEDNQDLLTLKYDDNNVLGTADYVSPEQANDSHDVDIRTDVYSLGATFYFCLTGKPLFPEGKVAQKLIWHQTRPPRPLRSVRPEVPEDLEAIVHKMLAKEKDARFQTPAEVALALEPWVRESIEPPSEAEVPRLSLAARQAGGGESSRAERGQRSGERSGAAAGGSDRSPYHTPRPATRAATGVASRPPTPPSTPPGDHTPRALEVETPTVRDRTAPISSSPPSDVPVAAVADVAAPKAAANPGPRGRTWTLVTILALAALSGVLLRYSFVGRASTDPHKGPPKVHHVERSGADGTFSTIRAALESAKPGDRVVVRAPEWEEVLRLDSGGAIGQDVTIEGEAPGGPVVWKTPEGVRDGQGVLHVSAVAGLRVRNFILDGRDQARHLVTLSGPCPNLVLEDLRLQGFRTSGVRLTSCGGEAGKPVLLQRVQTAPGGGAEAGVLLEAFSDQACRHVQLLGCRLTGPCQAGVAINGPVAGLELKGNQLQQLTDGVVFRKGAQPHPVQLTLEGNGFLDMSRAGLRLETTPPVEGSRLVLRDNRFNRVAALGVCDSFRPEPPRSPARWVWVAEAGGNGPERACFRKTFSLETAPTRAVLSLTAGDSFILWVNSNRVGEGEVRASAGRVPAFDVARHLRVGENVLAVEVTSRQGPAGLLAELNDNGSSVFTRSFASDVSWKAMARPSAGWQEPWFDDRAWPAVKALAAYGEGEPGWRGLVWDAVVQDHFQYQSSRVFPAPSGNTRDGESREGFPFFDAALAP